MRIFEGQRKRKGQLPFRVWVLGVSKITGSFLRVPMIRIVLFRGLYWGPTIYGNCHVLSG